MKSVFSLLAVIFFSSFQQLESIRIIAVAAHSGLAIEKASVSVLKSNFYVMTNELGQFVLPERFSNNDSLYISVPAYKDRKIAIADITGATIFMDQVQYEDEEKLDKKRKSLSMGPSGKSSASKVLMLSPGGQVLNLFDPGESYFLLQKLRFRTIPPVYDSITLRLRVYSFDSKSGQPGEDLLLKHLPLSIRPDRQDYIFDLGENALLIKRGRFYAGIEMIGIKTGAQDTGILKYQLGIMTVQTKNPENSLQHFPDKSSWFRMPDAAKVTVEGFRVQRAKNP